MFVKWGRLKYFPLFIIPIIKSLVFLTFHKLWKIYFVFKSFKCLSCFILRTISIWFMLRLIFKQNYLKQGGCWSYKGKFTMYWKFLILCCKFQAPKTNQLPYFCQLPIRCDIFDRLDSRLLKRCISQLTL